LGFILGLPSVDSLLAYTPESCCQLSSAAHCQTGSHGPLSWFLSTTTVYSTNKFAGLLHPAADHEVRRVSPHSLPKTSCEILGPKLSSPQRFSYPSKNSPRQQPARVTTNLCPLDIYAYSSVPTSKQRSEKLCSNASPPVAASVSVLESRKTPLLIPSLPGLSRLGRRILREHATHAALRRGVAQRG
jgi:hypothetical protein